MALRTKLNTNEEGETNGLEDLDDLDAVYVNDLENCGISEDLLEQFKDISRLLDAKKSDAE